MRHSLDRIINKPTDYVICQVTNDDGTPNCDSINWYENEACVGCGAGELDMVPATETRLQELCGDYADGFLDVNDVVLPYDQIFLEV